MEGGVCEEWKNRMNDICCLLEVRWRGQGSTMPGMLGRRYKLWWPGKEDGAGGVIEGEGSGREMGE